MNEFKNKDEEGKHLFQQYCSTRSWCKHKKSSKGEFSPWDVAYTSGSTNVIGEIKIREYSSDTFEGWFLQETKLNDLHIIRRDVMAKHKDKQAPKIQYINFFTDGQIMIWDITNLQAIVEQTDLPKTKMGDRTKVEKNVITLPTYKSLIREAILPIEIGNPNASEEDDNLPF